MNVVILNDFDVEKVYSAFDNIIIEFGLDAEPGAAIDFAEISGLGYPVDLSPGPDGIFYFNFKVFSKSYITQYNLQDKIDYNVSPLDTNSFIKPDPEFMQGKNITLKIYLIDGSQFTKDFILKYYRGVQDLERFNHYFFVNKNSQIEYTAPSIYYFPGYPLDIGIFTQELINVGLSTKENTNDSNQTELNTFSLIDNFQFARVILTNGVENLLSTNGADLMQGIKAIYIKDYAEVDFAVKIYNVVTSEECNGHYLKWLNRSGDFSYFLFSGNYKENIDSDSIGSLNNDFKNKEYNPSPSLSKGKTSRREMTLFKKGVEKEMRYFLSDLIDSPRVYYYTAKKGDRASQFDWIEVNVTDSNFELVRPKEKTWDYYLELEFPKYKNQVI